MFEKLVRKLPKLIPENSLSSQAATLFSAFLPCLNLIRSVSYFPGRKISQIPKGSNRNIRITVELRSEK